MKLQKLKNQQNNNKSKKRNTFFKVFLFSAYLSIEIWNWGEFEKIFDSRGDFLRRRTECELQAGRLNKLKLDLTIVRTSHVKLRSETANVCSSRSNNIKTNFQFFSQQLYLSNHALAIVRWRKLKNCHLHTVSGSW